MGFPGQSLVDSYGAILKLPDKGVSALAETGLIPGVAVLVRPQQPVIRPHITVEVGVIRPGGMHLDAFGMAGGVAVAIVFGKI